MSDPLCDRQLRRRLAVLRHAEEVTGNVAMTVGTYSPVEADHGRLKGRLRPMRGLTQLRSARVISTGHAFVQNLRRGHYELGLISTDGIGSRPPSPNSPTPPTQQSRHDDRVGTVRIPLKAAAEVLRERGGRASL